jgi:hypothetical protein
MKFIKLFENFNKSEIEDICRRYYIYNYSINPDGSIDVDGDVNLFNRNLTKLPLKFNKVSGYFSCNNNKLTSLDGCPKEVGGEFYYGGNPISIIIYLFNVNVPNLSEHVKIYLEYQEIYNFLRKDCKIVKHRLIEALRDFNEYYNKDVELPKKIEGYTYI